MNQQPNSVLRLTDFIFNNGQSVSEVGKEGRKIYAANTAVYNMFSFTPTNFMQQATFSRSYSVSISTAVFFILLQLLSE